MTNATEATINFVFANGWLKRRQLYSNWSEHTIRSVEPILSTAKHLKCFTVPKIVCKKALRQKNETKKYFQPPLTYFILTNKSYFLLFSCRAHGLVKFIQSLSNMTLNNKTDYWTILTTRPTKLRLWATKFLSWSQRPLCTHTNLLINIFLFISFC